MTKFISTKQLYKNLKIISQEAENGTVFIVLKHSKPVYKIVPLEKKVKQKSKYSLKDISKFTFHSKNKENNLALKYKKFIYQ